FLFTTWHLVSATGTCLAAESSGGAPLLSAETSSLLSAIIKVSGSLLVVVGIMLVLLYAIKRTGLGTGLGRGSSAITILETRMVAPKKYIAIVDVAGHCLALGITDHNINLLSDLGPETKAALTSRPVTANPGFAGLLKKTIRAQQTTTIQGDSDTEPTPHTKQESP
ncbi:MAG: flagellar biosynthetic protein FliO, partial [Desulfobulbaceae bacterium]|nr:flagellar biosynthetic protein FliO [Desulfobulbaceae bacterium]